jgi:hypothetical protein
VKKRKISDVLKIPLNMNMYEFIERYKRKIKNYILWDYERDIKKLD